MSLFLTDTLLAWQALLFAPNAWPACTAALQVAGPGGKFTGNRMKWEFDAAHLDRVKVTPAPRGRRYYLLRVFSWQVQPHTR